MRLFHSSVIDMTRIQIDVPDELIDNAEPKQLEAFEADLKALLQKHFGFGGTGEGSNPGERSGGTVRGSGSD